MSESSLDLALEKQREIGRAHGVKLAADMDRDMLVWMIDQYGGHERRQAHEHAFTAAALGALRERLAEVDS